MSKLFQLPSRAELMPLVHGFEDDFEGFLTAQSGASWTVTTAVDGTVVQNDAAGGTITISNATSTIGDNEDCYLSRKGNSFLFAADKPLVFEAGVNFSQVSTNTCNVVVGLTDTVAANLMVDNGAGPKASGTFLLFYTYDGSVNWNIGASIGATQTKVELTAANSLDKIAKVAASTTVTRLRIEFRPKTATKADVHFLINGVLAYKLVDWVFTSAVVAQPVIGIKGGTAAPAQVTADWCYCYQKR